MLTKFLRALLAFESGIDRSLFSWYCESLDKPSVTYPIVSRPGQLTRDVETGEPVYRRISIRSYFESLGVLDKFDQGNPDSLIDMQYASRNPWGFVGYQFGEGILIMLGYYHPALVDASSYGSTDRVPSYYCGYLPACTWRNGRKKIPIYNENNRLKAIATDTNEWGGRFTGKNGVNCFTDLLVGRYQEIVIRDLLAYNLRALVAAMPKAFKRNSNGGFPTLSGMLAAAHLVGHDAVATFLRGGELAADEMGTNLRVYLDRFGGFDITVEEVMDPST